MRLTVLCVLLLTLLCALLLGGCSLLQRPAPPAAPSAAPPPSAEPPPAAAEPPEPSPTDTTPVPGVLEGEKLKVLEIKGGAAEPWGMGYWTGHWSSGELLWWRDPQPGDTLELALPVATAGKYDVQLELTQAPDYAQVKFTLDGQPVGETVDLYATEVTPREILSLGVHELDAGEHKLGMEIVGHNEKAAEGQYFVGLDYVKLQPAT